jgi:hypothetical protein
MNEFFEKNIEKLFARQPEMKDRLGKALEEFRANPQGDPQSEIYRVIDGPNGLKNLLYSRANPQYQALYHKPDGISETHRIMREVDLKNPQMVFFFGCGLGFMIEEFLSNRPKLNKAAVIVEKNPMIFFHMLGIKDWAHVIEANDILWVVGFNESEIAAQLVISFEVFATVNRSVKILALPSALESEAEYYSSAAQSMMNARDQSTIWTGNSVEDSFQGLKNICDNLEFALQNPGIAALKEKFKGKTCISVAAGPSVNGAWDILRQVQGKIPIIACDTMLKPMNAQGVKADIITALERDPIVADLFRGHPVPERSTLIGPALLLPDAWNAFQGRKIAYCPTVAYALNLGINFLYPFAPGSSAGNVNLALAQLMGFSNIIMIGHNLAYGLGSWESHVKGTIDPSREKHRTEEEIKAMATGGKVPTADGQNEVYTIVEYNLFRQQIENMISKGDKGTRWINCAAKGAAIKGSEFMPLEEAIKLCHQEDFDVYPDLMQAFRPASVEDIKTRHQQSISRLRDSIETLEEASENTRDTFKKIQKAVEDITADEAQGKRWSDAKLNKKIDEFLSIKVKWVNERKTFFAGAIGIMHPAHIAFERVINEMPGNYDNNYALKRDFIKEHLKYFGMWNIWIPRILKHYQETMARLEKNLPADYLEPPARESDSHLDIANKRLG